MIRIPHKFGCKAKGKLPSTGHSIWDKMSYNREYIKPHLGDLFSLYRDQCFIFLPTKIEGVFYYCGEGYGFYQENRDENYDKIGQILAHL